MPSMIRTRFVIPWRSFTTKRFASNRSKTRLALALEKMPDEVLLDYRPAVLAEHRVHPPLILAEDPHPGELG